MVRRYALRDDQWEQIEGLLPGHVGGTARDKGCSSRRFCTVTVPAFRGGICRNGSAISGSRHTRWSKSGAWKQVFERLADDPDNEYAMIDSTIVRAHQHSAGAKGGLRSKRRSGTAKAD
jgi:transposase